MWNEDSFIGNIEDIVRETRLVDGARAIYEMLELNAPTFDPGRRRFLETAATVAAGAWLGMIIPTKANATPDPNWKAQLFAQDMIYGPPLDKSEVNGLPNGHINHLRIQRDRGFALWGGVDIDVLTVPIVPVRNGVVFPYIDTDGGINMNLYHDSARYKSNLSHLSSYSPRVDTSVESWNDIYLRNNFDLTTVIGYSGSSGGPTSPHLHWHLLKNAIENPNDRGSGEVEWITPGINPFTTGIDGGKPIYHDGETQVLTHITSFKEKRLMDELYVTLQEKSKDELGLNNEFYNQLLATVELQDFGRLQDYFRQQVLQKHPDGQGGMSYQFLPGSFMYSWTIRTVRKPGQEFLAMLPFINPHVVDKYKEANPGIPL